MSYWVLAFLQMIRFYQVLAFLQIIQVYQGVKARVLSAIAISAEWYETSRNHSSIRMSH